MQIAQKFAAGILLLLLLLDVVTQVLDQHGHLRIEPLVARIEVDERARRFGPF